MLLINARLEPVETPAIPLGYLQIKDGTIAALGRMEAPLPKDSEIYDLSGYTLYPGFVDAHCHIGMWEDGLNFEGDDGNEQTDPVTPQLRAIDAVNPMEHCFEEALQGGITTVLTGPGSANAIGGSWCAMKTMGRRIDDMIIDPNVGMKFALGENPKTVYHDRDETPITRMAVAALIREQLQKAKEYQKAKKKAKQEKEDPPEYDAKCEALLPVLKGKSKAFFHCHRADDIFTAIRIAKEFSLDLVLVHATEGYLVADLLQQEQAKIIAGPVLCDRSKPEMGKASIENPAKLWQAELPCAICTDHPVIPIQYLPMTAGIAIRGGLGRKQALAAITLIPAQLTGLEDRVGSLAVGKDADLVVSRDDIFSSYFTPSAVFCNGRLAAQGKDSPFRKQVENNA